MKYLKYIWAGALLCSYLAIVSCGTALQDSTTDGDTNSLGSSPTANVVLNSSLSSPASIISDSSGNFYVSDSDNNRIVKLSSTGALLATYGTLGSGKGNFHSPKGLAIDSQGFIWVADMNNDRIVRFNPASSTTFTSSFWSFGVSGTSTINFTTPVDIAIKPATDKVEVYVVDVDNTRVQVIPITLGSNTVDTANIESWTFSDNATFGKALAIQYAEDGYLYVVRKKGVVERYTTQRVFTGKRFGDNATIISDDPGDVYYVDSKLYIADRGNDKIHVYTSAGSYVTSYGDSGTALGKLSSPKSLYVSRGQVYVIEEANNRLQTFKEN